MGVDATPERNTATSVDSVDSCVSVDVGDSFDIDVVVVDVTDLLAWEAYLSYDNTLVQVLDRDVDLFQAASADSAPFNSSESVPDNGDGLFRVGSADLTSIGGSGSGVLARVTMEALAAGTSPLSVDVVDLDEDETPDIGPYMAAVDGTHIDDSDDDGFFNGQVLDASVAVGEDCGEVESYPVASGAAGPTVGANDGDDDGGWRWWMTALVAGGAAVTLISLIAFGYSRRRGKSVSGQR